MIAWAGPCWGWAAGVLGVFVAVLWIAFRVHQAGRRYGGGPFRHWWRFRAGRGKSVAELAEWLGMDAAELRAFTPGYREKLIAKRSGGTRRLMIPDDATKRLQRCILRRVLRGLRAHPAACGFERGKSVVDNARPHVGQAVVVKIDVVDFFGATLAERVAWYFGRVGWNRDAAALLMRLTTAEGGLPQGAPTSPRLANLVNFWLDHRIARRVARCKGVYTRYADDLTISFPKDYPRKVRGVVQAVGRLLRAKGYRPNAGKLRILRRHQRQHVTGLVVNTKIDLPRRVRRRLRAVEHRLATGRDATMSREALRGWQAYRAMIERQRDAGPGARSRS